MTMTTDLPGVEEVGTSGTWHLPGQIDRETGRPRVTPVQGRFIGMASSQREDHNRHTFHSDKYVSKGERCSACRWSVFRVFCEEGGGYTIHHAGMSVVPGETTRYRYERVRTAYEVVESMTTRRNKQAFLTVAAARVLAQCAAYDVPLRDAYENRAVG